jgi:hypothetical protein
MIDAHQERFGVEPIWRVLEVPTSSYYTAKQRPLSTRFAQPQRTSLQEVVDVRNHGRRGGPPFSDSRGGGLSGEMDVVEGAGTSQR